MLLLLSPPETTRPGLLILHPRPFNSRASRRLFYPLSRPLHEKAKNVPLCLSGLRLSPSLSWLLLASLWCSPQIHSHISLLPRGSQGRVSPSLFLVNIFLL